MTTNFIFANSHSQDYLPPMKELFRNPHTFDMNDYYTGNVFVLGGRDFESEEKESTKEVRSPKTEVKKSIELDWSFLKKTPTRAK